MTRTMTMETPGRTWVGMFDQPNFGEYPVMLSIRDYIRVDYPSLGCGGFLQVKTIEGGTAYLRVVPNRSRNIAGVMSVRSGNSSRSTRVTSSMLRARK